MLKLNIIDINSNTSYIYYDPYTFRFYLDSDRKKKIPSPYGKVEYSDSVHTAILPLGYNCPNKCVYCIQRRMKNPPLNIKKLKHTISTYIDQGLRKIHFLGGEPLLQWDVVYNVMESFPNMDFSIITNGLHLDLDICENLVKHRCKVTISHDGESQKVQRGYSILDHRVPQYSLISWLAKEVDVDIASVLCCNGVSMKDRYDFFTEIDIPFHAIDIRPLIPYKKEHLTLINGCDNRTNYFSRLLKDIFILSRYATWQNGNSDLLQDFIHLSGRDVYWRPEISHCPVCNGEFVTINQTGDLQYCHNTQIPIDATTTARYRYRERMSRCENCPVLLTCGGGCRIVEDDVVWDAGCARTYYYHLAYLVYYIYRTYGVIVTSIDGEYWYMQTGSQS